MKNPDVENTLVEEHIITACQSRDRQAFGALYNCCLPYVLTIVRAYVKCDETQKDLIQEIFAKTFLAKLNEKNNSN